MKKMNSVFKILVASILILFSSCLSADGNIKLNLKNVDIKAFIGTVSKFTGKNFVIDKRVKGNVTVISAHSMSKDEVYQTFLAVLQVHGFSAVPAGKVIKIIPSNTIKQEPLPFDDELDSPFGENMVTAVIQLKHVSAAQLIPVLRPIVPTMGHLAAYPPSNVIIMTDRMSNVRRLKKIIRRIDQDLDHFVEIITLKNASATEITRILTSMVKRRGDVDKSKSVQMVADERTNSILLSADKKTKLKLRTLISHLDIPLNDTGNTKVVYLKYAQALELVKILKDMYQSKAKIDKKSKDSMPVSIQADEKTNALIITASHDQLRSINSVIKQLDIRRAQVMVEAIIAEVSGDQASQLGVQWAFDGSQSRKGGVGGTNFSSAGINVASLTTDTPQIGEGISLALGSLSSGVRFGFVLNALSGDANTNILATPSIVTLDNTEASINVGQNVPFLTGQYTSTGAANSATNPFQTIQRENVGLTLKVKPQINEGNAIKLEIEQEVSSISATAANAVDLVTNTRSIKTTVMVNDGATIVLGGLLDDQFSDVTQKVPLLGDLPLIGYLFRSQKTTQEKRNLMVFLHPTIIRDGVKSQLVTNSKYNFVKKELDEMKSETTMLPEVNPPHLPDINALQYIMPYETKSE